MIRIPTPYDWRERASEQFVVTGRHSMAGGYCCERDAVDKHCPEHGGCNIDEILVAHGLTPVRSFFVRQVFSDDTATIEREGQIA